MGRQARQADGQEDMKADRWAGGQAGRQTVRDPGKKRADGRADSQDCGQVYGWVDWEARRQNNQEKFPLPPYKYACIRAQKYAALLHVGAVHKQVCTITYAHTCST